MIEQPNRGVERGRCQVHVALRRAQIAVPRELLNRSARRAPHREVGAERVPEHMHPDVRKGGPTRCSEYQPLDLSLSRAGSPE